jgi:TonB family protein
MASQPLAERSVGCTRSSAVQSSHSAPEPERPPQTSGHGQARKRRAIADIRRLTTPLLISLLFHALLLSLTFGDQASGLPGLGIPWRERRVVAPDLRVELVRAPVAAAAPSDAPVKVAAQRSSVERANVARSTRRPAPASAPAEERAIVVAENDTTSRAVARPRVALDAVAAQASPRTEAHSDAPPTIIPPVSVEAANRSDATTSAAPAAAAMPTPVIAVAPEVESTETVPPPAREVHEPARQRAESEVSAVSQRAAEAPQPEPPAHDLQRQANSQEAARVDAAQTETLNQEAERAEAERLEDERREAARIETERLEAQRREAARLAAQEQEAQRRAAARAEAERAQAERLEAERREAARIEAERAERERRQAAQLAERLREAQRQAAAREEAERVDAERREAERQEAARLEAERRDAARLAAQGLEAQRQAVAREEAARTKAERGEAERQDAARQTAQPQEVARIREEQEEDARREARRRAMARQLEEEAARRESATTADTPGALPLSLSTARRVRLWGRAHPDVELVQYAEAWALKIQQNTPVETVREIASRHHTPALVTVAVRSDGSVESVIFELSSGSAEVDDAIRRIVDAQRPYPAFPPALARRFDVIEIRRTWRFDTAVRLY